MIHQHIYATPPPDRSEAAFQDDWLNAHAVRFAIKTPQIAGYRLALRVPCSINPDPVWRGCAEIWRHHDAEQIASLQTSEFRQGARPDAPNLAAIWPWRGTASLPSAKPALTKSRIAGSPASRPPKRLLQVRAVQ